MLQIVDNTIDPGGLPDSCLSQYQNVDVLFSLYFRGITLNKQ